MPRDVREFGTAFLQDAQKLPALGEVAGEKEDDQNLDELDRLKAEEVHFRVADSRAGAEEDQRQRKRQRSEQRNKAQAAEQAR